MSTYRLIYILTTPIIATITLVIGYEYGHHLAALHGRTYRGGIGFGFSLWVSYAIFFIAFVFQSIYITKKNCNPLAVITFSPVPRISFFPVFLLTEVIRNLHFKVILYYL